MPESTPSLVENKTFEQKPFEVPAVQYFIGEWCGVHDKSITATFVNRETWDTKRETGLLENDGDGKKKLYLTQDLQLWEMSDVIESIDNDTFGERSEKGAEYSAKIKSLGKKFRDSGIYIAQRIDSIHQGRPQAESLAEQFYNYGQSLITGWKTETDTDIEKIAGLKLSSDETAAVDQWIAGDEVHAKRTAIAERKLGHTDGSAAAREELLEEQRGRALSQFFRKAELELTKDQGSAFLSRIKSQTRRAIETPKRELTKSLTRRGMDQLKHAMGFEKLKADLAAYKAGEIDVATFEEKMGVALAVREKERLERLEPTIKSLERWDTAETTLREGLNIEQLQLELELARETDDPAVVARKEGEIITRIQEVVSSFPYQTAKSRPSKMIDEQVINCTGASLLAGTLLSELGIKYLVGSQPNHSVLFVVTADGKVNMRDMLTLDVNIPLTESGINGKKKNGNDIALDDLRELSNNPQGDSLLFQVQLDDFFMVSHPETGHNEQILSNVGATYLSQKNYEQAAAYYKEVSEINPTHIFGHTYQARALHLLEQDPEKELVEAQKGFSLNPYFPESIAIYAEALVHNDHYDEAAKMFTYFTDMLGKLDLANDKRFAYDLDFSRQFLHFYNNEYSNEEN